ncbi:MAG TPA: hypothetical protein VK966_04355, partial [Longimicrobiales bacterium]|nr:hypothetical protein [Longimicrobiales bacterium]
MTRRSRPTGYLSAVLFVLTACGDSPQEAPLIDPGAPETVLGVVDGAAAEQFDGIAAVLPAPESGVVVADRGSGELRAFTATGEHVWTAGGPGEGPGEFRRLDWAATVDATGTRSEFVAWDPVLGRLTAFDHTGALLRTWSLAESDSIAAAAPVGVFPDGALLVAGADPGDVASRPPEGRVRFDITYAEYAPDGTFLRTLLTDVPGTERLRAVMNGRQLAIPAPFPRRTLARTEAGFLAVGANQGPWVELVDRATGEIRRIQWEQTPEPVTAAHLEAFVEELAGGAPSGGDVLRQVLDATDPPAHMPWYDQLLVSETGEVWVREHPAPDAGQATWRVFTSGRQLTRRVTLPASCRLHHAADHRL